ncbi:MAG: nucleoside-diphosphate kinase [Actinomycetia bacterium]|nr:nucleoside-diphosphate kinase [Actinomycetes bacterium]
MNLEKTLVIIKPDVVKMNLAGKIISMYEEKGLEIGNMRLTRLSSEEAGKFYSEHKGKEFYEKLIDFMTESSCIPVVFSGENAIKKVREINGATDPAEAAEGTVRKIFGTNGRRNAVHGSDSLESAMREISFFFS